MNGLPASPPFRQDNSLVDRMNELHLVDDDKLAERRRLFFMLLQTYLAIDDKELMVARTLHLLNTQGYYFDALQVLDIIPDDWPVDQLQDFLVHSLRRSLHDTREGQVVLAMSRGENLMVASEHLDALRQAGPLFVDGSTVCASCRQPMDATEAVVRHAQQLFHLACARQQRLVDQAVDHDAELVQ